MPSRNITPPLIQLNNTHSHFFVGKLLLSQEISTCHQGEVTLYSETKAHNSDFLSKSITFEICATGGHLQFLSLHVAEFESLGLEQDLYRYKLHFAPKLKCLMNQTQQRVLVDTSVHALLHTLLIEAGYNDEQIAFRLSHPLPNKSELIQAFESHYTLFFRLLSEHGLVYWFEHHEGDERIVVSDSNLSSPYLPQGLLQAIGSDGLNHVTPENFCGFTQSSSQSKLKFGSTTCAAQTQHSQANSERVYFEPFNGNLALQHDLATSQQLAYDSDKFMLRLKGNIPNVLAGHSFSLDNRITADSGDFLIVRSQLSITQAVEVFVQQQQTQASCEVLAIPRSTPLKLNCPPHSAKPMVFPAKVESIGALPHLDASGSYRVKRHLSDPSNDAASNSQALKKLAFYACAGQAQATGWHFALTPNAEVLVGCINNNPSDGFILGVTQNALAPSVVNSSNNTENRLLTASGNELCLNDDERTPYVILKTLAQAHYLKLDARTSGRQFIEWISQLGSLNLVAGNDLLIQSERGSITQLTSQSLHTSAKNTLQYNANGEQHWQSGNQFSLSSASHRTQSQASLSLKGGRACLAKAEADIGLHTHNAIKLHTPNGAAIYYGNNGVRIQANGRGTLKIHSNGGEISIDNSGNVNLTATNILSLKGRLITLDAPLDYRLESPNTASSPEAPSVSPISHPASLAISAAGSATLTQSVIELAYNYQDGSPVQNAPYEVRLDDGTVLTGQLDQNGQAQLQNVPPGQFTVVYGEDSRAYQPEDNSTPNPLYGQISAHTAKQMAESGNTAQLHHAQSMASQAGEWLWGTLQGDFNQNPNTSQIVVGTIISMIPVVDQIMDVRDIIANVMLLTDDDEANDNDAWIAFTLTGIGLIPLFGSAIKGVGKVIIKHTDDTLEAALGVLRKLGKGDPATFLRQINWRDYGQQAATKVKDLIQTLRDTLHDISTSWQYDLLLPDTAIAGMQMIVKRLDDVSPKIEQNMQNAAQEIGNRVNKALDDYQGLTPSRGTVGQPHKTVAKELEPPKGNELPGTPSRVIELEQGSKGGWNKSLNGKLDANATYKVGPYTYKTDEFGRVQSVSGKLELNKADRNTYQQSKAGKTDGIKDGLVDDEGGHLIASIFKGPGEQINYAAMDGNLNKGAWKRMENKWAEALKGNPPKEVKIEINSIFKGESKRSTAFEIIYEIDGKKVKRFLRNMPNGK
ncbi:DNA/RNA non-specific endonuclease [Pseudoalteromonas phenolica]|uniref:DNA/RNA non-specific endonuclease n=1 Tax=Pseudoalteromonas phenolica TaxID=161398 RepID=UPI00384F715B